MFLALLRSRILPESFFLTGGTALSVWYCHHRLSNDLDFFSPVEVDLGAIDFALARTWPGNAHKIRQSAMLLTYLIDGTKVDIVHDPLSFQEERPLVRPEADVAVRLDTIRSIVSNKISAMSSRTEVKDMLDYYHIIQAGLLPDLSVAIADARRKDALFDDPASAAFAIESNYRTIIEGALPFPTMCVPLDTGAWKACIENLIRQLYMMQEAPQ